MILSERERERENIPEATAGHRQTVNRGPKGLDLVVSAACQCCWFEHFLCITRKSILNYTMLPWHYSIKHLEEKRRGGA